LGQLGCPEAIIRAIKQGVFTESTKERLLSLEQEKAALEIIYF